jgi:signal transduction histidine kinase
VKVAKAGTELGRNPFGVEVLRSSAPLHIGDLHWAIIAEIAKDEALVPVSAMRQHVATLGLGVALLCFVAAGWLGASVTGPVLELAAAARRLGRGERGFRLKPASTDEVGQLAADFNRMSDDLERTTVSRDEFQVLAGRLITAQEDERKRVARELHDDFTQRLAAAAIEAGRLEQSTTDQDVRASLGQLKDQVARISTDVHTLSRGLHPSMLDDLGLAAAIEQECRASFERGGPIVELYLGSGLDRISKEARLALYRIAQEALRNIQRHSGAQEAELWLESSEGQVHLRIQDRGEGFDRTQTGWQPGLGLASMEERARLLGGTLRVESAPGQGTTINVSLPSGVAT